MHERTHAGLGSKAMSEQIAISKRVKGKRETGLSLNANPDNKRQENAKPFQKVGCRG
jgi:hypothetical protein